MAGCARENSPIQDPLVRLPAKPTGPRPPPQRIFWAGDHGVHLTATERDALGEEPMTTIAADLCVVGGSLPRV